MTAEHWLDEPEEQDFPAAESYLSLLVAPTDARSLVAALRKRRKLSHFAAKDLLRASGLPLLGAEDPEVTKDREKVYKGCKLSPVLLVRNTPLWVADGYHRICASYHLSDDTEIPCRIVSRSS